MNGNVIRTITIRGQAEGLDKLTADVNKLAAAQENVAVVSEQSAKRVLSLEDAWKRQTMRLDEAARAQANIARETKIADAALREGLATQAQHAQRLEQINQRYTTTAAATKVVAHQTGLARHELVNLSRQAQDVGVSLASGQSPFTVLVQQGTQIADVFATSGGSIRGFFSQAFGWAKTFLTSTTGIVTAVLAIGGAIAYAAVKFADAGKTIEEVLKEEQRLLKETKALIDEKTSLEAKAQLQSREQTTFEVQRNQLQLQIKLNDALRETADLVAKSATRPTAVAGEMGEAPTAVSAVGMAPGFDEIAAARERLNAAMIAGVPSFVAFNEELAKIGQAHPALALTVEKLIAANAEGVKLEQAAARTKALADALAGVATNAQLAAVGLGSIAQHQLNTRMAQEAAAATEQQAKATLQIASYYPGMSVEVSKQLYALDQQLTVAQARGDYEKIVAQEIATQNTLLAQSKTLTEAMALAAAQRAIAETNAKTAVLDQIKGLQDQLELIEARRTGTEDVVKQEQLYRKVLKDTGDRELATRARVAQQYVDEAQEREQADRDAAQRQQQNAQANQQYIQEYNANLAEAQQTVAQIEHHWANIPGIMSYLIQRGKEFEVVTKGLPQFQTWTDPSTGQATQFNPAGYTSTTSFGTVMDIQNAAMKKSYEATGQQYEEKIETAGGITFKRVVPVMDKLSHAIEEQTKSTDSLNTTMQNSLSPYYSMDPRTTKLGFRAGVVGNPDWLAPGASNANPLAAILGPGATAPGMANGGSFVVGGGDSANDNRIAAFPVASGEEIIVNRSRQQERGGNVINIDNRTIIQGSVDEDTMAKLKITQYQQSQRMRGALARA